jgi:hypothetical protein
LNTPIVKATNSKTKNTMPFYNLIEYEEWKKTNNTKDFNIKYLGRGKFGVKVAGKKYNPINLGESERCAQAIADLLELNYAPAEGKEQPGAAPEAGAPPSEPTPSEPTGPGAAELGPELAAAETPAPEEETPPAEA